MSNTPVKIAVIVGSTRQQRQGGRVADWFVERMQEFGGFDIDVVDLREVELPHAQYDGHPKVSPYPADVAAYAERIGAADGFVVVTPEYNHGYPASLKHALDVVYKEWKTKPMTFVGYGGAVGGARAIEQLRLVCGELHVVDIRDVVMLSFVANRFDEDGSFKADPVIDDQVKLVLTSLRWWAGALRDARQGVPYPV